MQRKFNPRNDRIFPYNSRSVGAAFRRACRKLGIENLHFHDLRHEATSRLFEAGLHIEEVALVTGHRDWKMLKRYTHLRPEHLNRNRQHAAAAAKPPRSPAADMESVRHLAVALWAQWRREEPAAANANSHAAHQQDVLGLLLQGLGTHLLAAPDRERPS